MLKGSMLHQALSSHEEVEAIAELKAHGHWEPEPWTDAELEAQYEAHLLTSPECGDAD